MSLIENIHRRLYETDALKRSGEPGRLITVRTVQMERNVLDIVEEDPEKLQILSM